MTLTIATLCYYPSLVLPWWFTENESSVKRLTISFSSISPQIILLHAYTKVIIHEQELMMWSLNVCSNCMSNFLNIFYLTVWICYFQKYLLWSNLLAGQSGELESQTLGQGGVWNWGRHGIEGSWRLISRLSWKVSQKTKISEMGQEQDDNGWCLLSSSSQPPF